MSAIALLLVTGFTAGSLHVLAGPDHLAAIGPLASHRSASWRVGAGWGLGHSGGVLSVGAALSFARAALPLPELAVWSERIVGMTLLAVGAAGIRRAMSAHLHVHPHVHGGHRHFHIHLHPLRGNETAHAHAHHSHSHLPFLIGALHGIAGSSHFFGVLPALALPSPAAACCYLASFGAGTIAAMSGFAQLVGFAAGRTVHGVELSRFMMYGFSLTAVVLGGAWLVRFG